VFKVHAGDADGEAGHTRSGDNRELTIETGVGWGERVLTTRCRFTGGPERFAWGSLSMVLWPALTLIGFVLLTAFVVAMGMQSTARYEREQRATSAPGGRQSAAEPVGAATA
jgi:hypothetical protein